MVIIFIFVKCGRKFVVVIVQQVGGQVQLLICGLKLFEWIVEFYSSVVLIELVQQVGLFNFMIYCLLIIM